MALLRSIFILLISFAIGILIGELIIISTQTVVDPKSTLVKVILCVITVASQQLYMVSKGKR